jgi:hypothetical protein
MVVSAQSVGVLHILLQSFLRSLQEKLDGM